MKIRFPGVLVRIIILFAALNCILYFPGCKKYLEAKPDKSLVTPKSIKDLQLLLDNVALYTGYPSSGELGADNHFIPDDSYGSMVDDERNNYIWLEQTTATETEWQNTYRVVFSANVALQALKELPANTGAKEENDNVKGSALFFRAYGFGALAQVYAPQYTAQSANTNYGIPLKLTADIEDETKRSTVQETYDRIINDAKESIDLLPNTIAYKTRPSKPAAYGLLARTYLVMGNYDSAGRYADLCLQQYDTLFRFSTLILTGTGSPFGILNKETIFYAEARSGSGFSNGRIDSTLYASYGNNDLRKTAYFRDRGSNQYSFKGFYSRSTSIMFHGIATDEMLLIRAECKARLGKAIEAMQDLNFLLETRWAKNTFVPLVASAPEEALDIILRERRKELLFRPSSRWNDLRRLNLNPVYAKTVVRKIKGQLYELPPNDPRYTLLIPASVIGITGIEQNPR